MIMFISGCLKGIRVKLLEGAEIIDKEVDRIINEQYERANSWGEGLRKH